MIHLIHRALAAEKNLLLYLLFPALLLSCGVKNGYMVGEYGRQPLTGQTISGADTSSKAMLGLLWQKDSLRITLNQGRHLRAALAKKDTLYLYEGPADTMDLNTERYTLLIPERELLIIKYNDSLVYPLMPISEQCEYPLEIKSMSAKKLQEYYERERENERIKEEQIAKGIYRGGGVLNAYLLAPELRAGTYLYNAGLYQLGITCDCVIDSTKTLILNLDGSWQQHENGTLKNCGIMRKTGFPKIYYMYNSKQQTVFFFDTIAITGQFFGYKEEKRRWNEHIPYAPNEFFNLGRESPGISYEFFKLYSCKQENAMPFLFGGRKNNFWFEGTQCGWQKITNK